MGTSASDYNDERAKEFAEKASEQAKHKKEYKAEWDAKMAKMKKKRTITLDEDTQKAFEERQRKALEIRERVLNRKNKG
jgi:hypothetical protein